MENSVHGYINTTAQQAWYFSIFLRNFQRWTCLCHKLWTWFPTANLALKPREVGHRPCSSWLKLMWWSQQIEREMKGSSCYGCSVVFPSISSPWKRPELLKATGEFYKENWTSGTAWKWKKVIPFKKDSGKGETVLRRNMGRMKR